jgi:phosphatidylinositol kinase/protein kinase (PI-3  family)
VFCSQPISVLIELQSPGNIGFEAAPFKLPLEYVEVLGGVDNPAYGEFKTLFRDGFVAARKHCDRIISTCQPMPTSSAHLETVALVELMQKDSSFPCFAALGTQTSVQLRERFQTTLTHALVGEHCERLIESSVGSNWTRLYDSVRNFFVGLVAPS